MDKTNLKDLASGMWRYLRQATGDDAYERYVAHHGVAHAGEAPLTRREYFKRRQEQKWSGVTRCC
ncbi:MAG TPA: YbdD/YjiX family protein [Burkholderiales bacterium]|nr:YbdD/YjiX family protein [Burkholderiales bacterium]